MKEPSFAAPLYLSNSLSTTYLHSPFCPRYPLPNSLPPRTPSHSHSHLPNRSLPQTTACIGSSESIHSLQDTQQQDRQTPLEMNANPQSNQQDDDDDDILDEKAMRAAEIQEVIEGLEQFKKRIIDDATALAKKVRANKKQLQVCLMLFQ